MTIKNINYSLESDKLIVINKKKEVREKIIPHLNYFKFFSCFFIHFTGCFQAFGFLELFDCFNSVVPVYTVNHQVVSFV